MSPVPRLCPLCLYAGQRKELVFAGPSMLDQTTGGKPSIIWECPLEDTANGKQRSHYRREVPLPTPIDKTYESNGWTATMTQHDLDVLPR